MGRVCVWKPGVNKDMSGEPSVLHSDLVSFFQGDREVANVVYAATRVEGLLDKSDLELDKNGEPTLEALDKILNLKSLAAKTSLRLDKQEIGAIDKEGNPIAYDSLSKVMNIVNDFNEKNSDLVAFPTEQNKKFFINVVHKSNEAVQQLQKAKFENELNNRLLSVLESLGFTAIYDDDVNGVFDPMRAQETAEGLKTIIRIARGEIGENAFPEEFAHAMIEGLQNHPLVSRLLNLLSEDGMVEAILGEKYNLYAEKYNDDEYRLRKEAAGHLLRDKIINGESKVAPTLLQRIWNFIKNAFSRITVSDINYHINKANELTSQLASLIESEEVHKVFNRTPLFSAQALYSLTEEVDQMQIIAEKGLEVASRRLKILQARTKSSKYDEKDVDVIKKMQELIEKKKYARSSLRFLGDTASKLNSLRKRMERLDEKKAELSSKNFAELRNGAKTLREIKEFSDGYIDVLETMARLESLNKRGIVELNEEDAITIADKASKLLNIINELKGNYAELRGRVVYEFLKTYWGEDKTIDIGKNKGKKVTLAHIIEMADKDINGLDRWVSSLSEASDPYLTLLDKAVKIARGNRDVQLEEIAANIRGIDKRLKNSGGNTEFMFERNEKGELTGRIISNINFEKYLAERRKFIESLKKEGLNYFEIKAKIETWEKTRTVRIPLDEDSGRVEVLPLAQKPGDPYYIDRLSKLNKDEREYYDAMMSYKKLMDLKYPERYTRTYNAIYIMNDLLESISQASSTKDAVNGIIGNFADKFIRRTDDTEFGEDIEEEDETGKEKRVALDFLGNPIRKLPVYYTRPLKDMRRLSTDFTSSMLAYSAAAIDYAEMSKIIDVLELARDLAHDREVQALSGDQKVVESFKVLSKEFKKTATIKGGNIAERLDDYMDMAVYGRYKKDEGTKEIFGTQIDIAKTMDALREHSGAVGLGLNIFSGIANMTVGDLQLLIEAAAGRYFNLKNLIWATKEYYTLLPAYLGEVNSPYKSSKLGLLIDKYDALEEFFKDLGKKGQFKSSAGRAYRNLSGYITNNIGEHYLHSRTMLAMLQNYKIKINGKEESLYDAWKIQEIKDDSGTVVSHKLVFKNGTVDKKYGQLFTEELSEELDRLLDIPLKNRSLEEKDRIEEIIDIRNKTNEFNIDLKLKIARVNQSMNGAFNINDRGAINKFGLGRLALQFRQWMPEHYYRRFAGDYYDSSLEKYREGYYRTLGRFTLELMQDARHMQFQIMTRWDAMEEEEKDNIRRSMGELLLFALLTALCSALVGWKDKDTPTEKQMTLYILKRMELETGASIPWISLANNFFTIVKSPAAAVNTLQNFTNLLNISNMFHEIQSGRYKGWSEWERDLTKNIPIYSNIDKAIHFNEHNMFGMFKF